MRGLTGLVCVLAAGPVAASTFDHAAHLEREASAAQTARCASCHALGRENVPDTRYGHADCNRCHSIDALGSGLRSGGSKGAAVCAVCHLDVRRNELGRPPRLKTRRPRSGPRSEFSRAGFDHAKHAPKTACAGCHEMERRPAKVDPTPAPEMRLAGHRACGNAICHGGQVSPNIGTDCEKCHALPDDAAAADKWDPYRVSYAFSHHTHPREGSLDCAECHDNVATPAGRPVPAPTKAACARCHNGQPVPGVTGTRCQYCHLHPGAGDAR